VVPALPPPTNISTSYTSKVAGCSWATSTVLNPDEPGMTPWNSPIRSLSPTPYGPSVPARAHSTTSTTSMPNAISPRYTGTVILVCSDHRLRPRRSNSNSTGKPSPPVTDSAAIGRHTHGSVAYRMRLSG
jgi:hypothetical protein